MSCVQVDDAHACSSWYLHHRRQRCESLGGRRQKMMPKYRNYSLQKSILKGRMNFWRRTTGACAWRARTKRIQTPKCLGDCRYSAVPVQFAPARREWKRAADGSLEACLPPPGGAGACLQPLAWVSQRRVLQQQQACSQHVCTSSQKFQEPCRARSLLRRFRSSPTRWKAAKNV